MIGLCTITSLVAKRTDVSIIPGNMGVRRLATQVKASNKPYRRMDDFGFDGLTAAVFSIQAPKKNAATSIGEKMTKRCTLARSAVSGTTSHMVRDFSSIRRSR